MKYFIFFILLLSLFFFNTSVHAQTEQTVVCFENTHNNDSQPFHISNYDLSNCGVPSGVSAVVTAYTIPDSSSGFILAGIGDDASDASPVIVSGMDVASRTVTVTDGFVFQFYFRCLSCSYTYKVTATFTPPLPTPTITPTLIPSPIPTVFPTLTPTPLPVGGTAQWYPSTPVPLPASDCPVCDYYLPLIHQNSEVLIHQNFEFNSLLSQSLNQLQAINTSLSAINTTLNNNLSDVNFNLEVIHADLAALQSLDVISNALPFYQTETFTTSAGVPVLVKSYNSVNAGDTATVSAVNHSTFIVGLSMMLLVISLAYRKL